MRIEVSARHRMIYNVYLLFRRAVPKAAHSTEMKRLDTVRRSFFRCSRMKSETLDFNAIKLQILITQTYAVYMCVCACA